MRASLQRAVASLLLLPLAGCGADPGVGPVFPVTGKITINDQPLKAATAIVVFKPDTSKKNTSPIEPSGTVDDQGVYSLVTKGRQGASLGWYKVVVVAHDGKQFADMTKTRHQRPVVGSLLPAKYGSATTTDLVVEVVENPAAGAYDLKLNK
jgi:hypothetical protein